MGASGFATVLSKRVAAVLQAGPYARPGRRTRLERVVLGVRAGTTPSGRPPVRIFVGTEPDQYRAERVFLWSIEQVRNPARVYELYLMKDLAGFDRRGWLTGFTNYRFAIPHFAEGHGRAIYNDTDQIYVSDPAALFDTPLGKAGFLSIHDHDTSVMLIDCERMAAVWTLEAAQQQRRNRLEAAARAVWGQLDPSWNARDDEYDPERSRLLHYTTIHAQPWQPFPRRFAYQRNPVGQVWCDLEQTANDVGYQVFQLQRPSAGYQALCARIRDATARPAGSVQTTRKGHEGDLREQVEKLGAATRSRTLLEYSFGLGPSFMSGNGLGASHYNPACAPPFAGEAADGVVCAETLDFLPDEDVPWMLEELFRHARRFVSVSVSAVPYERRLPDGARLQSRARPQHWWRTHLDGLSLRYPDVQWHLTVGKGGTGGWKRKTPPENSTVPSIQVSGGNLGRLPVVWVLTSHKPGTSTQALGLADTLGWPYTTKALRFRASGLLYESLPGKHRPTLMGVDRVRSDVLDPPWPDLIITAGWQPARVARWVQRQSGGRTRLVLLGRKGSRPLQPSDVSVVCAHFRFPPHPRRIETLAPLTHVSPERLRQGAARWRPLVRDTPHPWIMLLVGGATARYRLDPPVAQKMGEEVRALAERVQGKVFATTSRRTGRAVTDALRAGLGPSHFMYAWQPDQQDNPYMGYLALADVLIVTGESESMLAEAAATDTPLCIYPLPERPDDMLGRCKEWVIDQAQAKRFTPRGSVRPQRGLSYLCARLIERGFVQPRRDLNALHTALVERGIACFFGASVDLSPRPALREFDTVARQVRRLLGFQPSLAPDAQNDRDEQ